MANMILRRGKKRKWFLTSWGDFITEYQEAVNVLLDDKTWRRGFTLFPSIFLYRHYIELRLKEILLKNWEYLGIAKTSDTFGKKPHNIDGLWDKCRTAIQEVDKLVDPQFTESQQYSEQIIPAYNALEADLKKFAEIDPDSKHFRYPVDTHGSPIELDRELLIDLQRELPKLVKRISYNLDGISAGIHQILQEKYDGLSQQEE